MGGICSMHGEWKLRTKISSEIKKMKGKLKDQRWMDDVETNMSGTKSVKGGEYIWMIQWRGLEYTL